MFHRRKPPTIPEPVSKTAALSDQELVYRWEWRLRLPIIGKELHLGIYRYESTLDYISRLLFRWPWNYVFWALLTLLIINFYANLNPENASEKHFQLALVKIPPGYWLTVPIALYSYSVGLILAIIIGALRAYPPQTGHGISGGILRTSRLIIHNLLTIYVDFFRGIPTIILLMFFAFGVIPFIKSPVSTGGLGWDFPMSSRDKFAAIIPMGMAYGAFMSESVRAGILSVEKGQLEASRSLGMRPLRIMRSIVLPQALRVVTPPLGNDFIAIIKDSALVTILGMNDLTQLARINASSNFRYIEYFSTLALLYLGLVILATVIVRVMESSQRMYYIFAGFLFFFCLFLFPFRFPIIETINAIFGTGLRAF